MVRLSKVEDGRNKVNALSLAVSLALISWSASAQQADGTQADGSSVSSTALAPVSQAAGGQPKADETKMQEVIVTGTRRQSRLQSVPIAMSVISAKDVANSGFTSPSDLQYVAPSVNFNPQVGAGFSVRGVGSQGFDYNLEKSVSVIVDDVVQALPRSIGFNTLADIERIEVLKGPQGTLFGKNASAGAIFVVTRQPDLDLYELTGNVRFGSKSEHIFENVVNLPTSKDSAIRIATAFQRRDGYINNRYLGYQVGSSEDTSIRAKFLWQPNKNLDVNVIAEFQDHQDDGSSIVETIRSYVAPATPVSPTSTTTLDYNKILAPWGIAYGPNNIDVAHNSTGGTNVRQKGLTGTLVYRFSDYSLTSISAYKNQRSSNTQDSDNTPTSFYTLNLSALAAKQVSQELRLNSPAGGFYDYVIGAFYYDQDVSATEAQGGDRNTIVPVGTFVSPVGALANYTASSTSRAAFGQANFHLSDKWTAILGTRYTRDRVAATYFPSKDSRYNFTGPVVPAVASASSKDNVSSKVTLQYQATADIMTYANVAQGYKAPAVGTSRGVLSDVKEETATAYEIGIKTQFFQRKLTLNTSFFKQDFKNFQTQVASFRSDGTALFVLSNAPGMVSKGVEIDARLRASNELTLTGTMSYNPTEYKGFLTSCYAGQSTSPVSGSGCFVKGALRVNDVSGQEVANSPKKSYSLGVDYHTPVGPYQFYSNATYSHRSSAIAIAGDPNTRIDGYGLLNGNLGLASPDGKVKVALYGRNLLNKFYTARIRALSFAGAGSYVQTVPSEAFRTLGIRLDYSF